MAHPFETLTPDLVLDAVESIGFLSDARILALNSYENRVYQVGIEDSEPLIAKFYRPQRWTNEAILEEHRFTFELAECEVPVVAPMIHNGESLFEHAGFRFTLFPRRGGRAPEPGHVWVGTTDGVERLHRTGGRVGDAEVLVTGAAVPAVASDDRGGCWFAAEDGTVGRVDVDGDRRSLVLPGPDPSRPTRIVPDSDTSAFVLTQAGTWHVRIDAPVPSGRLDE